MKDIELTLDNPIFADFERMPATFEQFISDPYYLGGSWKNPWPFWVNQGKKFFPLPLKSPYSALVLLGATGIGKTSFAVNMVAAYFLHIVLCLRNPQEFFALEEQKNIVFAFMNIVTKAIAYKNAWGMLHKALLKSPFFMEYGIKTTGRYPEWVCKTKPVELLYGSTADQIIGLDIIFGFLDEISFARNQDIGRQMEKAKEVFDAALERIQSRFTKFGGIFDGLIVMASSKRTDQAFAEVYSKQLMEGKNGIRTFVVDNPRWEVLPKGTYSGETFPVAVGDKTRASEIITEADVQRYKDAGYKVIFPPLETYDEFQRDMMHALTNIAGESVSAAGTFLQGSYIAECVDKTRANPFTKEVIFVGSKDNINYWDYFELSRVAPEDLAKPLYIHLDASLGSDGNSISGGNIAYAQQTLNLATGMMEPELHYKQIFKIKVRAPKGDRIMLRKNEQFIFWLRSQGFNVALVTSDQYQSVQFGQDLAAANINYRYQSIDKVTNGVNQPYSVVRNAIYDKRVSLLDDEDQLEELRRLVQYEGGRVDKPMGGHDDAAQVLAGWMYAASLNKEDFIRSHAVLDSTFIGSTEMERRAVEESVISPELLTDLIQNEFGASRVPGYTGLREAYEEAFKTNRKLEGTEKEKAILHIF